MTIDVSNHSVDYCKGCGGGHYLVDGLCRPCREVQPIGGPRNPIDTFALRQGVAGHSCLVVHATYLATIYGTPAMHAKGASCPICERPETD